MTEAARSNVGLAVPAGRSPHCPSCGRNVTERPHPSNRGKLALCCRGYLASLQTVKPKPKAGLA